MNDGKITPAYEPGDNFLKKLDNFWYHYKWTTIIVGFFAVVLIVCTLQMCTRDDRDLCVLYSDYEYGLGRYLPDVESAFESIAPDFSGDGASNVAIVELPIISKESYDAFRNHIFVGDTIICLLSPELYSEVYVKDDDGEILSGFVKLEDVLGYKPENAYDDYSIRIGDTPLAKDFSVFKNIDNDESKILLCLRKKPVVVSPFEKKEADEYYEYCTELFKSIIEYKPVSK